MSDFSEPPRRCPVCGGTRWADKPSPEWGTGPDGEPQRIPARLTGEKVCVACTRRRLPRLVGTVADQDPDRGSAHSTLGQLPAL